MYISLETVDSCLPPSPPVSFKCPVCQMFSYSPASFSDKDTCNKCSLFAALEARLGEFEQSPAGPEQPALTLVIGSSILRNVKLVAPATAVVCVPGAKAGNVECYLKLLAKDNHKYRKIILHVGGNDTRLRKSEITKMNVKSLCAYAKTMSDSVVFSGPLPNLISDDMYSRMSSFHRWLSWCPANDVGYIDNWRGFWGKPGLIRRVGIHPTLDGAALISKNLTESIIGHKP
uniref:SGNH hydrolase-type esterase domain-containing protein n=1 Tax=Sander lucioperca TaxID=283035 RepID=A0A8D0D1B8_SANLU